MNEKIQTYDSSLFFSKHYFFSDGAQFYLMLQPFYYTLKLLGDTEIIVSWISKGFSAKKNYYSYH